MEHLTIVLQETRGQLAKISKLMANADINIEEINAEEIDHHGVMYIGVKKDKLAKTYEVLRDAGYQVMPQRVLLVRIEDKPGGLAALAVSLEDANISVRSLRIAKREEGVCLCAIDPEPFDAAQEFLSEKGILFG